MKALGIKTDAFGLRSLHSNIYVSSFAIMAVLWMTRLVPASGNEDAMVQAFAERFRSLSGEELFDLWHSDCHRRCRAQLLEHVNLACSFDPYKIVNKRSVNSSASHGNNPESEEHKEKTSGGIFLTRHASASFLANGHKMKKVGHKIVKRGIMEECCFSKSCSWEEYGEFCHAHNRHSTDRITQCYK